MRIWHYKLLPYLPERQFRGQFRELVAIMRDWRDRGRTNHILINKVMEYHPCQLTEYFLRYAKECRKRYGKPVRDEYIKNLTPHELIPWYTSGFQ